MSDSVRQAAVIPVHDGRVYLVTSRSGRRWVLPKGLIDPGHTPGEAALIEAWEEAGVVGVLDPNPLGTYLYEKLGREHLVLVYRMTVTEARDEWPERSFRQRELLTVDECVDRVDEPGLRDILRSAFRVNHPDALAVG